jgi:hypothetical protein
MARGTKKRATRNQGEGDREAARRFNEKERAFVASKRGRRAIEENGLVDPEEAPQLIEAQVEAMRRAREHDPQEKRNYRRPTR